MLDTASRPIARLPTADNPALLPSQPSTSRGFATYLGARSFLGTRTVTLGEPVGYGNG